MQKEQILEKLKEKGCRITKQRLIIIDIILQNDCSCCKEIYYNALKKDKNIGAATVYRIINILEEIGAVNRGSLSQVVDDKNESVCNSFIIQLADGTKYQLSEKNWNAVISAGLKACGYPSGQGIKSVMVS